VGIPSQEVGNFSEQVWGVSTSVVRAFAKVSKSARASIGGVANANTLNTAQAADIR
jgi:hypothetical protein